MQKVTELVQLLLDWLSWFLWPLTSWLSKPAITTSEVAELIVYPVKACRGVSVQRARIKDTGFVYDRHWVVVTEDSKGRFKTQRNEPKLALVDAILPPKAFTNEQDLPSDANLELRAPGRSPLKVPLTLDLEKGQQILRDCSVWEWQGKARDEGNAAAAWFTEYLEKPCRLLAYAGTAQPGKAASNPARRATDAKFAKGYEVAFADGFPFLLASKASLEDLNTRLQQRLPMNRFRPNIIVAGSEPWQEDTWQAFRIAGDGHALSFRSVKPCSRCKVTTTNQATAEVSEEREPLTTLGTFRSGQCLGWKQPPSFVNSVFFGWNLVADRPTGVIAVGDQVQVSRWRTPAAAA